MPRNPQGTPSVRALLDRIADPSLTPRTVERARVDKLGPSVTGTGTPPEPVILHYQSLLPMRRAWGKKKLDKRLLPLYLAVQGEPVIDDYVRSNLIAYLTEQYPSVPPEQADTYAERSVAQFGQDFDQARISYRTDDSAALGLHHAMINARSRDLRAPMATSPGDTQPHAALSSRDALIASRQENDELLRRISSRSLGGPPLDEDHQHLLTNLVKNMDNSTLRELVESAGEDNLAEFAARSFPPIPALIEALGRGPIPRSVLDETWLHSYLMDEVSHLLDVGAPTPFSRTLGDIQISLVANFVTVYWLHLHPELLKAEDHEQ